jgi:hypothetical protein
MTSLTTRPMTYDEVAATFGIARTSARQLVQRRRWMKRKGNDGKVRADVPLEALPTPDEVLREMPHEDAQEALHEASRDAPQTHLLRHLIERLEAEVAELRPKAAERDAAVAQVDALQAIIAVERQRVEEWKAVADRWAMQAERLALTAPTPPVVERRGLFGWFRRAG